MFGMEILVLSHTIEKMQYVLKARMFGSTLNKKVIDKK